MIGAVDADTAVQETIDGIVSVLNQDGIVEAGAGVIGLQPEVVVARFASLTRLENSLEFEFAACVLEGSQNGGVEGGQDEDDGEEIHLDGRVIVSLCVVELQTEFSDFQLSQTKVRSE